MNLTSDKVDDTLVREAFSATVGELQEAHGVSDQCVHRWRRDGAFPHAQVKGRSHNAFIFHVDAKRFTLGEIKKNIKCKKFCKPSILLDDVGAPETGLSVRKLVEQLTLRVVELERVVVYLDQCVTK